MTGPRGAPVLALTQGDPAGIGPELLLRVARKPLAEVRLLLVAERAALAASAEAVGLGTDWEAAVLASPPTRETLDELPSGAFVIYDPVAEARPLCLGESGAADAAAALACLDAALELAREGVADALVTAPVSKESIARHVLPGFRGHTDYLAEKCGLGRYGADYLMAFLTPELQVALLTTHLPLAAAVAGFDRAGLVEAVACLDRHAGGSIAVAGLNPHAGEGGLLGTEDDEIVAPAVAECRAEGIDVHGPFAADSLFARARRGEFDWVLALYHDQGLIPVKTLAFGAGTNWTLGLPILRTSVDHGTAFSLAGTGGADPAPLRTVLQTTTRLIAGTLPRKSTEDGK